MSITALPLIRRAVFYFREYYFLDNDVCYIYSSISALVQSKSASSVVCLPCRTEIN